jgi:small-conductance mechanosensitive channel
MAELFKNFNIQELFTRDNLITLIQVLAILVVGYLVVRLIAGIVTRALKRKLSPQVQMLVSKTIVYIGVFIIFLYALNRVGVQLAALLGAAGVVGIALGIASQTSLSNIISGVFLISEKPFEIGDVISVGSKTGIIISIDLLSIKMRTFDNLFIRIPNEKIINDEVTNITRFPIRRLDFNISVAYKEDLGTVKDILFGIARDNPLCLDEPEPLLLFKEFGDSGIELLFGVWFEKDQYLNVKNGVFEEIKQRFDEQGIEIPYPHQMVYSGTVTKPFPVVIQDQPPGREKRAKQ